MTIIDKIRTSIQRVHGDAFEVYYHDEETLNVIADTMKFPCAMVQLLTQGAIDEQSGQYREVVSAAVFFVELSSFDFDADENEIIIDRCKHRALKWVAALPLDNELYFVQVERTSRVYERFDAILTGYGLLIRLGEIEGVSDCPEALFDFNDDFNNDFLIA